MKPNKAEGLKEDNRNLEYLMSQFNELTKMTKAENRDDSLSVLYTKTKECVFLKSILSDMVRYGVIHTKLSEGFTNLIKSIEIHLNNINKVAISELKAQDKLSALLTAYIFGEAMLVCDYKILLLSLMAIKVSEIKSLKKQGEKLREMIEKQKKESEEKTSLYVC